MWARWIAAAAVLFALLASSEARAQDQKEQAVRRRERATLLATKLPDAIQERNIGTAPPAIMIGVGVLSGVVYVGTDFQHQPVLASSLIAVGGGTSYFLLSETHRNEALQLASRALQGTFYHWLGDLSDPGLDRSLYAIASGYYTAALLEGLNLALSRHPGITRLRHDYARVASPEGRSTISAEELAAIERDFLATERPIPRWLVGLPLVLGGGVALVPAFESDVESQERTLAGIFGTLTILQGLTQLIPDAVGQYRSELGRVQLGAAPLRGGGALVLSGSF